MSSTAGGSASRWGPLFGAQAAAWAETWEGPQAGGLRSMSTCSTGRRSMSVSECSTVAAARAASCAWHPIEERASRDRRLG